MIISSVDSGIAFLTDADRFLWKSQSEFCVVGATHKFKSFGSVCSTSFFSLPASCRLFSRGVIFMRARVSLALLSLRKNGGLLVVYFGPEPRITVIYLFVILTLGLKC